MSQASGSSNASVLLVEDERTRVEFYETVLRQTGFEVRRAASAEAALRMLPQRQPDLILADMAMPDMTGLELLETIGQSYPEVGVVLLTAQPRVSEAVEVIKMGALDYLDKSSLLSPAGLADRVIAALEKHRHQVPPVESGLDGLIGHSPKMLAVFLLIRRAANTITSAVIYGETGTGKEVAARAIHAESPRAHGPFLTLDCSALAADRAEIELFGCDRDADADLALPHRGRIELARQGTLFLDCVESLDLGLQAKLWRVLQSRTFRRRGGNTTLEADARIIAASDEPLEEAVARGDFRRDLYDQLRATEIRMPALRERLEDIPLLVDHFLAQQAAQTGQPAPEWSAAALARLQAYDWPGNVRELENVVYRIGLFDPKLVIEESEVDALLNQREVRLAGPLRKRAVPDARVAARAVTTSAPDPAPPAAGPMDLSSQVDAQEKRILLRALARNGNNRCRTAVELKISRSTLYNKLDKYAIHVPDARSASVS